MRGELGGRSSLPSQRRHVFSLNFLPATPEEWLRDRQQRDETAGKVPSQLWMIHGKLYDLAPFIDRHPGGKEWLEFTRGMDCSVEFETHHLDEEKAVQTLRKYYVRDADAEAAKKVQAYTFDDNGFYRTFKRSAFKLLKEHGGSEGGDKMRNMSIFAVLLWTISFFSTCIFGSFSTAFLSGFLLLAMFGVGHNYFHQRNHPLRYAMDLTFAGHHQWRISHAISHHGFPNLDIDIELSQFEPLSTYLRSQPANGPWVYLWVLPYYSLAAPLDIVRNWLAVFTGTVPFRPEHLLRVFQLVALIACQGLKQGILLYWVMHTVGALALFIASFPVHRTEYAWSDGCQSLEPDHADFGEHVVAVAHDYGLDLGLFGQIFLAGSFNNHIIHHLLPTLDLSKQYLLLPLLDEVCENFKVRRHKRTFMDIFNSYVRALYRLEKEGLKFWPNKGILNKKEA
eukprot:m.40679 g.40679  ORF g.40679 m.40679 type:complete len:452 (-) comp11743_c0_seq1:139-1494(-)